MYALPALVVLLAWLRLESERGGGLAALAMPLLALAPALLPNVVLRLLAAGPAVLVAAWLAFDRPSGAERGFFPVVAARFEDGVYDYWDTNLPFAAAGEPNMHALLLLGAFAFCLGLALAIASRRPVAAILVLLAGAGWPLTLAGVESVGLGAVVLAAALWVLAGLRAEQPTFALAAGVLVVLAGAGAATSSAVAKDAVLDWRNWEPSSQPTRPVSVSYVWDANYGGIEFPAEKTTVLRITAPPDRKLYWRATTLDRFTADRWIEDLWVEEVGPARGPLPDDPLLPPAARTDEARVTQEVQVVALRDNHLIAAAQAVALDGDGLGHVGKLSHGVVRLGRDLNRGERYTVESYVPKPEPAELATLEPNYPTALWPQFQIARTSVPGWGEDGREEAVEAIFRDPRQQALWPYRGLYRQAQRLADGARTPYGAVVAIEAWLRTTGGFAYDEQPPAPPAGVPPLAHFVADGKRGYCQQFAGAMALMLRFLGIPARVAAGFTSGTHRDGVWTVTDHNAHTWVEVWFPSYGWLSFDPTPGRGALTAAYSASSESFNAGDAAEAFTPSRGRGPDPGGAGELGRLTELKERSTASRGAAIARDHGRSAFWTVLALVLGVAGAIGLGKLGRRQARYLTSDPRRLASAARRELAEFLADQGITVPESATADELQALVRSQFGLDARAFALAVAAARYGPLVRSGDEAAHARRELRALLRLIRRAVGRPQRLRGFVALRSLRA